jgi:hypothetical protein
LRFTRLKAAGIAAGVAAFAFLSSPALAGGGDDDFPPPSGALNDGVDFDAACLVSAPLTTPGPNNIESPGGTSCGGAVGVGSYDGSTETTDIGAFSLTKTNVVNGVSNTQLVASWTVDGCIPAAGSTANPALAPATGGCPDLPNNSFAGGGLRILFNNPARQNNVPTNSVGGGCPRLPTGTVFDQHEHWLDGFHKFIGFDMSWDGAKWIHSAQVGEYDPSPDGAFFFTELGTSSSPGVWSSADPFATFGTNWDVTISGSTVTVTVDGVLGSADAVNCATGVFYTVYAKAGDTLVNVKALSTANSVVTLPVTVPLSLIPGQSDITSVAGFLFYSDVTEGSSTSGPLPPPLANRTDVSFTGGPAGLGPVDTLGDSPACPTPTFGGLLPTNPLLNPAVGCQYDDDNIPVPNAGNPAGPWTAVNPGLRGVFLTEWWDTAITA